MCFYTTYSTTKHGKRMDTEISYAGIFRRVSACVIDGIFWITIVLISLILLNKDEGVASSHRIIFMATLLITYIVLIY